MKAPPEDQPLSDGQWLKLAFITVVGGLALGTGLIMWIEGMQR